MFDSIHSGILAKLETKSKNSKTVQLLALKFEAIGEKQGFLSDLSELPGFEQVPGLFRTPIPWRTVALETPYVVDVTLHNPESPDRPLLAFRATLRAVKVSKVWKHGADVFTYVVALEKDLDPTIDKDLAHFVNVKARNARTDKMELVLWPWKFEAIESVAMSANTSEGDDAGE